MKKTDTIIGWTFICISPLLAFQIWAEPDIGWLRFAAATYLALAVLASIADRYRQNEANRIPQVQIDAILREQSEREQLNTIQRPEGS